MRFSEIELKALMIESLDGDATSHRGLVCTENLIRVDDLMESPKLAE